MPVPEVEFEHVAPPDTPRFTLRSFLLPQWGPLHRSPAILIGLDSAALLQIGPWLLQLGIDEGVCARRPFSCAAQIVVLVYFARDRPPRGGFGRAPHPASPGRLGQDLMKDAAHPKLFSHLQRLSLEFFTGREGRAASWLAHDERRSGDGAAHPGGRRQPRRCRR